MTAICARSLRAYGVAPDNVYLFNEDPRPEHQEYLDLIAARTTAPDTPDGVAEAQAAQSFISSTRRGWCRPVSQPTC